MAITTYLVGTSGRDYSTWPAAIAALPATSDGNSYVLAGYNDSEFVSGATIITLAGHATDETYTIKLTAAPGQSFVDNSANGLDYNSSNGVGLRVTPGIGSLGEISDDNVTIERLQLFNSDTSGGSAHCLITYGANAIINDCIIKTGGGGGTCLISTGSSNYAVASNTTFIQGSSNFENFPFGAVYGAGTLNFCSVVYPSDSTPTSGVYAISNGWTVNSCAFFGFDDTNPSSTYTTCMTDVASPPTGCTTVVYDDQFEDTTSAGGNWSVKAGADLIGAGTYDANYPVDAFGVTRADPPTIGPKEFVTAETPNFVLDELIDPITGTRQTKVLVQTSLNDLINNLSANLQTEVIDNLNLNKILNNLTLNALSDVDVGLSLNKLIGSPTEWSTLRKGSGIAVSGSDNLTITRAIAGAWHSIYSTTNHASGKFYIKFTSNTVDGIDGFIVGIGNNSGPTTNYLGSDSNAIGLQSNGNSFGSSGGTNQGSWSSGDELLLAIDADNKKAYLRRNGSWIGSPSQGTGFISWTFSGPYYFGWSGLGGGGLDRTTASLSFDSDVELVGFKSWDDLTDFSSQVLVQTSLNTLISNLSANLQSTVLVQTSLNQTLAPIILSGVLNAVENLVLNKTIDEIDLNASSNVVVSLNLNKTIDAIVSSANATVILNINVNTNINNLTLSSTLQLVGEDRNLVLNVLVDNLDLDSTVQVIVNAALNSLINSITSAADVDVVDNLNLNKTLDNLILTATATQGGVSNIVVNATIDNVTSVATLTTVAVELNIVVDTTIDNLTLNARANRRSGTGDNVAWWWKQYVARHAQERLLEREVVIHIISPVGVLSGELVGVKEEVINVRVSKIKIPDPVIFRGDFVSVTAQVGIEIICGVSGKGDVVGKNPKIKADVSVGNEAQVNTPIILSAGILNAKTKLINIINGNISSPEFSGYGFAESGYIVDSKIIGVMPLIIAKCETGIVGEGRIVNNNLIEINTNISHGINSSGKLVSEVGNIASEVNVGFEVEIKPITLSTIVIDAQISNGVAGEGKIIIDPRLNIYVDKSNGNISNEISIVSPVGFIKKLNIIDGNYIKANIGPPLAIIMSDVIFGINNDIRINVPAGQVKGKAEVGIKLVLIENSNIITSLPFINAFAEHDPDDEDSLTTVLLLAA